jgi:peptidyl-prolyl cis-trans isomerase C
MIRHFGKKVTASHILIGPSSSITGRGMIQQDAITKLLQLKEEINDDPDTFATLAEEYSSCRATNTKGGDLGEFGPGLMVGPFDKVCFEEEVGKVHGPVTTPFGVHLILIKERA